MTTTPGEFTLLGPGGELIAHGSMSALTERILDSASRRAAERLVADAAEAKTLLDAVMEQRRKTFNDNLRVAHSKLSTLVKRMDALEAEEREQQKLDAEEEQREIKEYLDQLPDPDDPSGHGDLNVKGPPDQDRYRAGEVQSTTQQDSDAEDLDARSRMQDAAKDQGDLPGDLTKKVPSSTGNYFDPDPDDPTVALVRDPPSSSLN